MLYYYKIRQDYVLKRGEFLTYILSFHLVITGNQKVPIMFKDLDTYCQEEIRAFMMLKIKFIGHLCEAEALLTGKSAFQDLYLWPVH